MISTPGWYALHALEQTPARTGVETDYPAPLFTRRVFSNMAAGILGAREHAPVRIAMAPSAGPQRRPPG